MLLLLALRNHERMNEMSSLRVVPMDPLPRYYPYYCLVGLFF
jgi:hypothetical protein